MAFLTKLDGCGWLYLFGLNNGRVKVGRTIRVRERLAHHRRTHGAEFAWAHVFPQHESGINESCAISSLSEFGQRVGRTEMFDGLSKDQAIALCRALVNRRLTA